MNNIKEYEKKFLIDSFEQTYIWDKEQLVYQWYVEADEKHSMKKKLIFDLKTLRIIFVEVEKQVIDWGLANKTVTYLDYDKVNFEEYVGKDFVLKRRVIQSDIFVDRFIRSNNATEYLVEVEGENNKEYENLNITKEVTKDEKYYNQNMCVTFTKDDLEKLNYLLDCFKI